MKHPDEYSTLREWLAFRPGVARILAGRGLDLCGNADRSLAEVCRQRNLDPLLVKAELNRSTSGGHQEMGVDWATAPLAELCQHLQQHHHDFCRHAFPRLAALLDTVTATYSASHPETGQLAAAFQRFRQSLEAHIEREEGELFPRIRELAALQRPQESHSLARLINSLEADHDAVDAELLHIRELTHGFVAPHDVCQTFQSLLDGLWELEMNLHQSVHEENRFLFPRALRREAALTVAASPSGRRPE